MTITPHPALPSLLLRLQFHLMELALHEQDLDFLLIDLEKTMSELREYYRETYMTISAAFEELQTHFATKNRFVLAAKLQIAISSLQGFRTPNQLKPYLDQIKRHIHSKELLYHMSLFQIALVHSIKPINAQFSHILESIKQHYPNREYVDNLYQELIPYYTA